MSELTTDRPVYVAVIGDGDPHGAEGQRILSWAEEVGERLARAGAVVVTGGLGGVMEAASRGATNAGGLTIGILPGDDRSDANAFVRVPIATGLGVARNLVVVTASDVVIAVGGRYGTLSEIGLALRQGRGVVTLGSWRVGLEQGLTNPNVHIAGDPSSAVERALRPA
ncbi:MAG TPA: TIGR00725 family protein [Thermomicrobiales bacterium]|nr:TIGR00725 family protein [Thermomicrobiales bacterium]